MGRSPRSGNKEGMKKGVWTAEEDQILKEHVRKNGEGKWGRISRETGLKRCGKSVRLRWLNYLRPNIKRGNIAEDEEELIIRLHKLLGNRWSLIAGRIPGRTDNEIKNYWNSTLRRKLQQENHLNEIKENSSTPSGKGTTEDDPHSTKNNGEIVGGGGGMGGQPISPYCFTNHNVKEEDLLGSTTTTTSTAEYTTSICGVTVELEANNNHIKLAGDDDLSDDVTWNDFIMNLNEDPLDISEFLQADFLKLQCESETPMNLDIGGCSSDHELSDHELVINWEGMQRQPVASLPRELSYS